MPFLHHGYLRVACAVPTVRVADPHHNGQAVIELLRQAEAQQVAVVVFPELCLTGYTCGDLFHQATQQRAALQALEQVRSCTESQFGGVAIVGLPALAQGQLFNCAAIVHGGRVEGLVPKQYLPNYREFYEARYFSSGLKASPGASVELVSGSAPLLVDGLVRLPHLNGLTLGVEVCEDLWVPCPPSSRQALAGALLLCNPSASNDLIGKAAYRRELVVSQSGRCIAGYLYASCGAGESTTDVVYGGHCLIAENGVLLAESPRFQRGATLLVTEIDLDRLTHDRVRQATFSDGLLSCEAVPAGPAANATVPLTGGNLLRPIDAHPFVPQAAADLQQRCDEIFSLQVAGLAQRLQVAKPPQLTLGVSGGLDSTLGLLVACKTLDQLERPRTDLLGVTMPGYGTSRRTLENARNLLRGLGVSWQETDIRGLCLDEWRLMGHRPFGIDLADLTVEDLTQRLRQLPAEHVSDLVFENVQARMRTILLMNQGFMVGTGDLSELAVGWCTYNGDHMSMYNPNVSIPKTLVKWLVRYAAQTQFTGPVQATLLDIVGTEISPELLPLAADGSIRQRTESAVGPYELIDFFLYHFLRFGTPPPKLLWLAEQARFDQAYTAAELKHWLELFLKRFFASQFKRSCLPDGPKVGSIALSPRGDWRMPSDASVAAWLEALRR